MLGTTAALLVAVIGCLAGCTSIQPERLSVALQQADTKCESHPWPSAKAQTDCMDSHELWAFIAYAPAYQDIYREMKSRRDSLASLYDARQMSAEQLKSSWEYFKEKLSQQLSYEVTTNNAADEEAGREVAKALLTGVASYYNARAATDAATINQMNAHQLPRTTYTECQSNTLFMTVDCTSR